MGSAAYRFWWASIGTYKNYAWFLAITTGPILKKVPIPGKNIAKYFWFRWVKRDNREKIIYIGKLLVLVNF